MGGSRGLAAATAVFALGLAAVVVGMNRYDAAYTWVAHTSDVRMVVGRAVGHAGRSVSCEGLRGDADELAALTRDNRAQQARIPALRASVEAVCASRAAPALVDQLADFDATERGLMVARRDALGRSRRWSIAALFASAFAAILVVAVAGRLQRRAARALGDSEERFRVLASSSTDLIRIHDAAGRPTWVSPSCERLLGYTPDEVLALAPLALGHPDDLDQMRASLAAVQAPHGQASSLLYRLRAKDGTYRWFETNTSPVRDRAGALLRFYTTARDVTERIELQHKLEEVAVTDELTGLLNRRGFQLIAEQQHRLASRQRHGVAVVFADLDGLKTINDRLGHDHGDRAIRDVGAILRRTFRESDVVARLGGDEFAVLAYDIDAAGVATVVERLRAAVAAADPIGEYPLAVSVGTALLAPGTPRSLDDLVGEADRRMYDDKRSRRAARAS